MKKFINHFLAILLFSTQFNLAQSLNGCDLLFKDHNNLLSGKRIGVICNHSSLFSNGTHLVDSLLTIDNLNVQTIFTPEHGFKGTTEAGEKIDYANETYKGIKVISLYGSSKKPTTEMLKNIDLLLFDIQDVGARYYTYISTLYYCLEAASENKIQIIVLDRKNPIGGIYVDGPLLDLKFQSFVGIAPIPITHGMTIGELAKYFIGEKLIQHSDKSDLTVIKTGSWDRNIISDNQNWDSPSPNINSLQAALLYPGTCLLEGTNISEGRGTEFPFVQIGAPFIDSHQLISELNKYNINGVKFEPVSFTPADLPGMASNPKYKNENCNGIFIKVTEPDNFESVKFGVVLLTALTKLYTQKIKFTESYFDKLAGSSELRKQILEGFTPGQIFNSWQDDLKKFEEKRNKYLLY